MISRMKERIQKKLGYMGLKIDCKVFIYMRFISSLILFLFFLFFIDYGYVIAPVFTIIYYVFVELVILDMGVKRRIAVLESDALEFMPVFLICMKNGRNIKNAIQLSTSVISNDLSLEFSKVIKSVELGKSLDEALNLLKQRMPSVIITNILISIMEANRLGNSVNDSINIQLEYIRENKKKEILNKYKTIPFKLAIISICFVFIVLLLIMIFNFFL